MAMKEKQTSGERKKDWLSFSFLYRHLRKNARLKAGIMFFNTIFKNPDIDILLLSCPLNHTD